MPAGQPLVAGARSGRDVAAPRPDAPFRRGDRVAHADGRKGGTIMDKLGPLVLVEWPDKSVTSHDLQFGTLRRGR